MQVRDSGGLDWSGSGSRDGEDTLSKWIPACPDMQGKDLRSMDYEVGVDTYIYI